MALPIRDSATTGLTRRTGILKPLRRQLRKSRAEQRDGRPHLQVDAPPHSRPGLPANERPFGFSDALFEHFIEALFGLDQRVRELEKLAVSLLGELHAVDDRLAVVGWRRTRDVVLEIGDLPFERAVPADVSVIEADELTGDHDWHTGLPSGGPHATSTESPASHTALRASRARARFSMHHRFGGSAPKARRREASHARRDTSAR
jgi:hypothetical protein